MRLNHSKSSSSSSTASTSGADGGPEISNEQAGAMDESQPVHYFVMGPRAGWASTCAWPPPDLAPEPLALYLGPAVDRGVPPGGSENSSKLEVQEGVQGVLATATAEAAPLQWKHKVEPWKHPKGFTRYDAMIRLTRPIRYTHLRSCGHLTFVGTPLQTDLVVVGAPQVHLWVSSSDSDADVFAYLEDQDPETGKARYVTEGVFRASHRAEADPSNDPRAAAHLPGTPFHSFTAAAAQPLAPGEAGLLRFQMMPTAYRFARGHCVRLAISGADAKHFHIDHKGPRTIWVHTGGDAHSCLRLPHARLLPEL